MDSKISKTRSGTGWSAMLLFLILTGFLNQKYFLSNESGYRGAVLQGDEKFPPSLALTTIVLGPLRGLIANTLWWRISEQQDEGNYFEVIQLSEWITALQPENPRVWTYQAWNMAYNVAYEFPDGDSKWKWIFRSYKLLAMDAIKYNPESYEIKKETARIFFDRIGSSVDPGAPVFRKKWASLIIKYLPQGDREELKKLALAPRNESELRKNQDMDQLLRDAEKAGLDLLNQETFYAYQTWSGSQKKIILEKRDSQKNLGLLDSYFRASGLRKELGLDPKRMLYIDNEYGSFDWRLYQAYVVYFAATGSFGDFLHETAFRHPMIRQAMTSSFLDGRLLLEPEYGIFVTTPNFKIIAKLHDYYDYMMIHNYSPRMDALHKDFLERAAAILYSYNQIDAAKEVFGHFKEGYADESLDFETYIADSLYKTLHNTTAGSRKALVESSLFQAYNWLATGDVQRAIGYANFAKMIWKNHQGKYKDNPALRLPPFEDLMNLALQQVIASNIAPEFKKRLQNNMEIKEFELQTEKTAVGDIFKQDDAYKRRTGERIEGNARIDDSTEE